ncbi:helicase associated domain-containing protein [Streptomyces europaeiscabiei]|uniref:helicase associated domain-containing protein n=1 Tax=Streptomyces europaeiscabiei TaxID=146819 RepID=UPI0038D44622
MFRQGEDLGRWVKAVRFGWDKLTGVQQWMCEQVLGIEPATGDEKPKPRTSQADKWAMNYAAAKQYYQREGHLKVPRKHVETIAVGSGHGETGDREDGEGQEERELRLGAWVSNQRSRAATLSAGADGTAVRDRHALGMKVWNRTFTVRIAYGKTGGAHRAKNSRIGDSISCHEIKPHDTNPAHQSLTS